MDDIRNDNFYNENEMGDCKNTMDDAIKPLYLGFNKSTKLLRLISLYKLNGKYGHLDATFKELLTFFA